MLLAKKTFVPLFAALSLGTSHAATDYLKVSPTQVITNAVPYVAMPLPLSDVRLTGGPLKNAQALDAEYLLKLDPDRMFFYLRQRAGLKPKAEEGYGGWDGAGRQLTGHIAGHYLSAISYMWAATGDQRFKDRVDYVVNEFKEVQDAQGDGYIGALMATAPRVRGTNNAAAGTNSAASGTNAPVRRRNNQALVDGKIRFEDLSRGVIQSGGFDLNGMWSPWYVEHKIFAGLRDAYRLTGNRTALDVEVKFAGWVDGILSPLTPEQIQRMLATEFGGMNEVMADLYADTGDPRWLKATGYFEHHAIIDPLAKRDDILGGKHGNTNIPKVLGDLMRYVYAGDKTDGDAARFFWDQVVYHHSFATGGHGHDEYFGPPDKLNNIVDGRDDESCNVYNMLKMTRVLFALHPDDKYAEFQERALFNHVLASIDPQDGRTCYMVPVGHGVTHEYQDMFESFTCCVGTGMENHALHGYGIYYESGDKLWVNFYTPSTASWKTAGATLNVQTDFPEGGYVSIKVSVPAKKNFTLALRRPSWAGDQFVVAVNGKLQRKLPPPGNYVEVNRTWKDGDTVELTLPKQLHKEALPDNPDRVALMWGPLVLAGDLGPEERRGRGRRAGGAEGTPVFVAADRPVADWVKMTAKDSGEFHTSGVGEPNDVRLVPFYRLPRRTYEIYWDLYTPEQWEKTSGALAIEQEKQHKLELATVGFAQPGEMQPERDYNEQGEDTQPDRVMGRAARRGTKWFSFDLPVDPAHPMSVVVTYYSDEWRRRTFDILADGQRIGQQVVEKGGAPHFFDAEYSVPADVVKGKQKVTIRFEATEGNEIAAVFGVRMIRADAAR